MNIGTQTTDADIVRWKKNSKYQQSRYNINKTTIILQLTTYFNP